MLCEKAIADANMSCSAKSGNIRYKGCRVTNVKKIIKQFCRIAKYFVIWYYNTDYEKVGKVRFCLKEIATKIVFGASFWIETSLKNFEIHIKYFSCMFV